MMRPSPDCSEAEVEAEEEEGRDESEHAQHAAHDEHPSGDAARFRWGRQRAARRRHRSPDLQEEKETRADRVAKITLT